MPNTHRRCDETVLSHRRCEHNLQLAHDDSDRFGRQFGNWPNRLHSCLTTWILIDIDNFFNNDDIMTSLLKKFSISIKIVVIKSYGVCLVSFQIVDRIRRQSSWTSVHTADATKTVSSHRWCVLGITGVLSINYAIYTSFLQLCCEHPLNTVWL